jgi:hypothetical protein
MKLTENRHSFRKVKSQKGTFWKIECSDDNTRNDHVFMGIVNDEATADKIVYLLNIASQSIMEAFQLKKENPYRIPKKVT